MEPACWQRPQGTAAGGATILDSATGPGSIGLTCFTLGSGVRWLVGACARTSGTLTARTANEHKRITGMGIRTIIGSIPQRLGKVRPKRRNPRPVREVACGIAHD